MNLVLRNSTLKFESAVPLYRKEYTSFVDDGVNIFVKPYWIRTDAEVMGTPASSAFIKIPASAKKIKVSFIVDSGSAIYGFFKSLPPNAVTSSTSASYFATGETPGVVFTESKILNENSDVRFLMVSLTGADGSPRKPSKVIVEEID